MARINRIVKPKEGAIALIHDGRKIDTIISNAHKAMAIIQARLDAIYDRTVAKGKDPGLVDAGQANAIFSNLVTILNEYEKLHLQTLKLQMEIDSKKKQDSEVGDAFLKFMRMFAEVQGEIPDGLRRKFAKELRGEKTGILEEITQ